MSQLRCVVANTKQSCLRKQDLLEKQKQEKQNSNKIKQKIKNKTKTR